MSTELAGRLCRSKRMHPPTPAVILGTFDASSGLDDDPRLADPDSAYCLRCAAKLHAVGWFTPDDVDDVRMLMEHFDFIAHEEHRTESETAP